MNLEKLSAVANAELMPWRGPWAKATVSPPILKVVLWTLWAFEGQPITYGALSERAGVSIGASHRAVGALIDLGLVVPSWPPDRLRPRYYTLVHERLREMHAPTALGKHGAARSRKVGV